MAERTLSEPAAQEQSGARTSHLFTSESVTEGHPDKIADQISDSILDAALADDPMSRVACETLVTTGLVLVSGEITTTTYVDIPTLVRKKVFDIGYTRAKFGFDYETCGVMTSIDPQSGDIAQGVDHASDEEIDEVGAGDQGDDVRLRLPRDRAPDAAAHNSVPRPDASVGGGTQDRDARLPAARRQESGHGALRRLETGSR